MTFLIFQVCEISACNISCDIQNLSMMSVNFEFVEMGLQRYVRMQIYQCPGI